MASLPGGAVQFSHEDIPFECYFPSDFRDVELNCQVPLNGYSVEGCTDELSVTIFCFQPPDVTTNTKMDEYLDALTEGQHSTIDCVSNPLPNMKEFPLPTPFLLSGKYKAVHVAVNFSHPSKPLHLLWGRCLLHDMKIQFQLSGAGPVSECLDRWLVILKSFKLKS